MALLKEKEYRKQEKMNGIVYDMSPAPGYQHGIINGNIYRIIGNSLKIHYVLYLLRILISDISQM